MPGTDQRGRSLGLCQGLPDTLTAALRDRAATRAGKRVFVDPKGADYARYQGCFLMKPNRLELSILTGLPARNHEETLAAGSRLSSIMPGTLILVTEGADGMTLFADSRPIEHIAFAPRQVYDVTGRGGHRAGHSLPGDFRRCIVPRCHGVGHRSCCHCYQHHGYRDRQIAPVGNRPARRGAAQCRCGKVTIGAILGKSGIR